MKRIVDNKKLLKIISKCSNKHRKVFLKEGDDEFIKSIIEIVLNVLRGNVKLCPKLEKALKKYKNTMRKLICLKTPLKQKRQLLVQKGGFLSILLPSLISGVLSHIFSKKD